MMKFINLIFFRGKHWSTVLIPVVAFLLISLFLKPYLYSNSCREYLHGDEQDKYFYLIYLFLFVWNLIILFTKKIYWFDSTKGKLSSVTEKIFRTLTYLILIIFWFGIIFINAFTHVSYKTCASFSRDNHRDTKSFVQIELALCPTNATGLIYKSSTKDETITVACLEYKYSFSSGTAEEHQQDEIQVLPHYYKSKNPFNRSERALYINSNPNTPKGRTHLFCKENICKIYTNTGYEILSDTVIKGKSELKIYCKDDDGLAYIAKESCESNKEISSREYKKIKKTYCKGDNGNTFTVGGKGCYGSEEITYEEYKKLN